MVIIASMALLKEEYRLLFLLLFKYNWDDAFGKLLEKAATQLQTFTVVKVENGKTDLFTNSQEVNIDAPVSLCEKFGYIYICYMLTSLSLKEA